MITGRGDGLGAGVHGLATAAGGVGVLAGNTAGGTARNCVLADRRDCGSLA